MVEFGQRLRPRRLERIYAQIERRAGGQRLALFHGLVAKSAQKIRGQPFGKIAENPFRRARKDRRRLRFVSSPRVERGRRMADAAEMCFDFLDRQFAREGRAPIISARGVSDFMSQRAEARRRSASNTSEAMPARSFDPAKRWARPQSLSASAAGRRRVSRSSRTSIAAAMRAEGCICFIFTKRGRGAPSFHRRRGDAIAKCFGPISAVPQGQPALRFAGPGRKIAIPGGSLSVGRIGWSFAMSMIRRLGAVASLLLLAFTPAAPATAGRFDAEARPQPFILYCFNRYTGAFLYWGMCAGYEFPCPPPRKIGWRHPNYFMPHYCSPEDERRA